MIEQQNTPKRSTESPQQESATVTVREMREVANLARDCEPTGKYEKQVKRWADVLSASEQTARDLAGQVASLQARVDELEKFNGIDELEKLNEQAKVYRSGERYWEEKHKVACEQIADLKAFIATVRDANPCPDCAEKTNEAHAILESRTPAPEQEVDWESCAKALYLAARPGWHWDFAMQDEKANMTRFAKAVVAAYEAGKEKSDGD